MFCLTLPKEVSSKPKRVLNKRCKKGSVKSKFYKHKNYKIDHNSSPSSINTPYSNLKLGLVIKFKSSALTKKSQQSGGEDRSIISISHHSILFFRPFFL